MPADKFSFLITRPDFDDTTAYCLAWSGQLINEANDRGFAILDLRKEKATLEEFEGRMKLPAVIFVMLNGHGTLFTVEGDKGSMLLEYGKNEHLTKGKIIFARSRYSLEKLGGSCAQSGALGYVGYSRPFFFVLDSAQGAHPLNDELAKPCFIASNLVALSIIKGQAISEAVRKSREESEKLKAHWQTRPEIEAPLVASFISWNSNCLDFCGSPEAKLQY